MKAFDSVTGKMAPMLAANIDTDVIMPKQFLKGINREGLKDGVFFDQRFLESGDLNPEFVLNQPALQGAKFLAVGPNFGCGSSREHAVWGLLQLGIRCIIGTTFAGIFFDNSQRNGLLAIELTPAQMEQVSVLVSEFPGVEITVDLARQKITLQNGEIMAFDIETIRKDSLLSGLDAIGTTLRRIEQIELFEETYLQSRPWLV